MATDVADDPVASEPTRSRLVSAGTLAQLAVALGGAALAVSLSLRWFDFTASEVGSDGPHFTAIDVSVRFLFDRKKLIPFEGPSLLAVLLPAVVVGLVGAVLHIKSLVFTAAGVALVVAALFVYQVQQSLDAFNGALPRRDHFSLTDLLGAGPYVCGAGAAAMIAGGWFLPRRTA